MCLEWGPVVIEADAYSVTDAKKVNVGLKSYYKIRSGSIMISKYISFNKPYVTAVSMVTDHFILKKLVAPGMSKG